ncbi:MULTISPECIES: papain-like cysteine protease family protein [unclassified Streptomyces]|uniref:papain-like cysteine protease family protein n=1 Tax=unclassified Streptomyces TaxID=2593676 RepID=UPI002E14DB9B|nr:MULTISPECIES: papain-like cysteine protease family protein [unclassified Streptomyces]WSR25440.1 C39 family peptidase [Streptomyces sp. NBC_01205]
MRNRNRRLSLAAVVTAVLFVLPTGTATAVGTTPSPTPVGAATGAARESGAGSAAGAALAYKRLNITMQAQQKTNWCWAASGNTIATWFGRNYTQNQFCNAAFNRQQGYDCPNDQANLGNVQTALNWAGINSGSYVSGWLRYATVQGEIDANRPVETRIQWSNGGGHMHVIYGYDTANSWVYWGDPWPSSDRYNWASHAWYVDNGTFSWTHSLYRIGA